MYENVTRHFIKVTGDSLSRLTALVEQAAAVLDQRGTLAVRKKILGEMHFALSVLRAADNSLIPGYVDTCPESGFLAVPVKRVGALRAGQSLHPALAVVAGTDVDGPPPANRR